MAAAVLPQSAIDDVTIRSMPPKPSLFVDPKMAMTRQDGYRHPIAPDMPNTFIPPQAERVPQRARMPRIEELPLPAQREIMQKRGELGEEQAGKAAQRPVPAHRLRPDRPGRA